MVCVNLKTCYDPLAVNGGRTLQIMMRYAARCTACAHGGPVAVCGASKTDGSGRMAMAAACGLPFAWRRAALPAQWHSAPGAVS